MPREPTGKQQVEGNLVKWQKWEFRVGFNYREGLVLHQVGFEDQGRVRPVVHRLSLVEMSVPYAEPRVPYHVRVVSACCGRVRWMCWQVVGRVKQRVRGWANDNDPRPRHTYCLVTTQRKNAFDISDYGQ
jgi:hypothetical protein